jgi:diguanylate cyclase (GGDEF)-like protein
VHLDIPTILVLQVLASLMSALVLGASLLGTPGPGGREATAAMAGLVPAFLLYMLRGRIPESFSIIAGNLLFWGVAILILRANTRFASDRAPARWPFVLVLVVTPGFAYLATSGAWYGLRVLISSAVLLVLISASGWELAREGGLTKEPWRRFAFALLTLTSLGFAARIALVLPDWHIEAAPLAPTAETMLAFIPGLLLAQGFGPAFLLMQRERSAALARELATTDVLTGCLNRRALEERATIELAHAARKKRPIALAVVDLDHFKKVNDTYGHAIGDVLLTCAGRVLRQSVRPGDVVARYGGEEFCILFREADAKQAKAASERLCNALRAASIDANGTPLSPRASIGVAALDPNAEGGWQALFRRADEALYRSKRGGRDRVSLHGFDDVPAQAAGPVEQVPN